MSEIETLRALYDEEKRRQINEDEGYTRIARRNEWFYVGDSEREDWRARMEAVFEREESATRSIRATVPSHRVRVAAVVQLGVGLVLGFAAGYIALGL